MENIRQQTKQKMHEIGFYFFFLGKSIQIKIWRKQGCRVFTAFETSLHVGKMTKPSVSSPVTADLPQCQHCQYKNHPQGIRNLILDFFFLFVHITLSSGRKAFQSRMVEQRLLKVAFKPNLDLSLAATTSINNIFVCLVFHRLLLILPIKLKNVWKRTITPFIRGMVCIA